MKKLLNTLFITRQESYLHKERETIVIKQGKQTGNVLLRRAQYRWAGDEEKSVSIARLLVAAKIANGRAVLMREIRNHGDNPPLSAAIKKLATSLRRVQNAQLVSETMGIEGDAANAYFSVFNELLRGSGFAFGGRVRRPPTDPVNAPLHCKVLALIPM